MTVHRLYSFGHTGSALVSRLFYPDRVPRRPPTKGRTVSLGTILLIVLILILLGVLPAWPHARSWGYAPSGIVGVVLVIVIVLFLMGRL